jgi:hypothetical protein
VPHHPVRPERGVVCHGRENPADPTIQRAGASPCSTVKVWTRRTPGRSCAPGSLQLKVLRARSLRDGQAAAA